MNAMTKRLAWKETALLRPICIVSLILLAMILFAGSVTINNSVDFTDFVGNLLIGLGGVVGLACGILLFVFEREAGTDTFLETFPVDGRSVARTKLIQTAKYFLIYSLGSLLLGGIALAIYNGGMPKLQGKSPAVWLGIVVLIPIQCLLWALLCSLTFRSSLQATITSAILTVVGAISIVVMTARWTSGLGDISDMQILVAANGALALALAGAVWYLSPTWLRGRRRTSKSGAKSDPTAKPQGTTAASFLSNPSATKCAYPYNALMWQNFRRCWVPWLIIAAGLLVLCFILGQQMSVSFHYFGPGYGPAHSLSLVTQFTFIAAGASVGMLMFASDQSKSNFLFFQQQADYPRRIWFSRFTIFLTFLPVVIVSALMASPGQLEHLDPYSTSISDEIRWILETPTVLNNVMGFIVAVAAAQLITVTIRLGSGFVAFIFTVVASVVLFQLLREVVIANGLTPIFLGPFIVACFATTWWFAPRWISRRWAKTSTALAYAACGMVLVGSIAGWTWYRANRFPLSVRTQPLTAFFNDADSIELANANLHDGYYNKVKLESAAALRNAVKRIQDYDTDRPADFPYELSADQLGDYFAKNESALEEIADCLKDPNCGLFLNPRSQVERDNQKKRLRLALAAVTQHHLESKDMEAALESLVAELRAAWWVAANEWIGADDDWSCQSILSRIQSWAPKEGNTEQLIRKAIAQVDAIELAVFDRDSQVLYREAVFEIERAFDAQAGAKKLPLHDYPWEIERSRRWNLLEAEYNSFWTSLCSVPGRPETPLKKFDSYSQYRVHVPDSKTIVCEQPLQNHEVIPMARLRNLFRYTQVRLALAGWKLEHNSYPDKLTQLCEGENPWLEEMPCSFFSGREFAYSGVGLDGIVFFTPGSLQSFSQEHIRRIYDNQPEAQIQLTDHWIEEGTPFLLPWSGVVGQKRPIVRRVTHKDGTQHEEETVEYAYWIPNGHAGYETRRKPDGFLLK